MKYLILFLILTPTLNLKSQVSFDWLLGTWERVKQKEGTQTFETWQKSGENSFHGNGVVLEKGDTTFSEQLSIEKERGKWYYIANVSHNVGPVKFEMDQITDRGFHSENSAHDFPKEIDYQFDGINLLVTISGGDKSITFQFIKVP